MVKITYKGETRDIPQRYIPKSLTEVERKKQIKSIFEGIFFFIVISAFLIGASSLKFIPFFKKF